MLGRVGSDLSGRIGSGWVSLDQVGLGWVGLGQVESGWVGCRVVLVHFLS